MKEKKIIDTAQQSQVSNTTPSIVQLSNLAQGNTDTTRIGNKVTITGLQFKYMVADTVTNIFRIMFILDKQTNGAIYAAGDVLDDASAVDNIVSLRNRDESGRFQVLYDKIHIISLTGQASGYASKFIKLNIPLKFSSNAGDITDLTSNSLSMMHVSQVASSTLTSFVRVFYNDS